MKTISQTQPLIAENLSVNDAGHLTFAGKDTVLLAEKYGTPLYLLDEDLIRRRCREYRAAMQRYFGEDSMPLYAGKALCITHIYRIMREENMGIDVVSSGEIYTAYHAGFPMEKAYFHGNNKTDDDIAFAMECGVGTFVCDSVDELEAINRIAAQKNLRQRILLRLTPGIDPHTHKAITTGQVDSKFGAAIETGQAEELVLCALSLENIELLGYHCHIGSQIFEIKPFVDAARIMLSFSAQMNRTHGFCTKILNLGGGMGVRYLPDHPTISYEKNIALIAEELKATAAKLSMPLPTVLMEPGRSIVADSGMTLYRAGSVKQITGFKNYVSIDGGMPDNPRFALYESPYTVLSAARMNEEADFVCTVAGRCCESGDLIQEGVSLPMPRRGDVIAVLTTGAYNYSMASNYNRIPRPPMVALSSGEERLILRRETFRDLTQNDL